MMHYPVPYCSHKDRKCVEDEWVVDMGDVALWSDVGGHHGWVLESNNIN